MCLCIAFCHLNMHTMSAEIMHLELGSECSVMFQAFSKRIFLLQILRFIEIPVTVHRCLLTCLAFRLYICSNATKWDLERHNAKILTQNTSNHTALMCNLAASLNLSINILHFFNKKERTWSVLIHKFSGLTLGISPLCIRMKIL